MQPLLQRLNERDFKKLPGCRRDWFEQLDQPALGTELPGKPKERVRHVTLDQRDMDQDVLMHPFEKIETAEEFCGVTRTPDGADELVQHAEALDELDLRDVVRSATPTQSIYKTDLMLDVDVGDVDATHPPPTTAFVYDEWDGKARQYKPAWCTVYASHPSAPTPHDIRVAAASLSKHARIVREVRLLLDRLRSTRILRNRQPEGADIDLDAVVDRYATVTSGHQPDDRLYLSRRRHHRDLATLVLIDMSYSTDAWIQGERVLDIARDSALVLGEVLAQWRDRVAMAGFYSHTRRDCRFVLLKSFDTSWERSKGAIAGLEPTGYTRIGPALRHGMSLLQHERASKKLLILISDGKPTDYDRYEGRYGVADVRQAVREAHQARIHTYALAIDAQARLYLPQMFGSRHFQILPHPAYLVRGLAEVYSRLSR
jgi:nitric oxide reductase NorD protein